MINEGKEIGGTHYSTMKVEPIELINILGLDFSQGNIVKYISRYRNKGGIDDIEKALHYSTMNILEDNWDKFNIDPNKFLSEKDRFVIRMYCMLNGLDDHENVIIGYAVTKQYKRCSEEIGRLISRYEEE